jgi:hypothetical protein
MRSPDDTVNLYYLHIFSPNNRYVRLNLFEKKYQIGEGIIRYL